MPRADFSCRNCGKAKGYDGDEVIVDIPIECKRCPQCGFRRGFRRLYNAVNVSTTGHRVAQVLDKMMEPHMNGASAARDDAKRSERQLVEDHARAIEMAPEPARPAMRQALEGGPVRWLPHSQANLNMVNPIARSDSRNHIFPHIKRRLLPVRAD